MSVRSRNVRRSILGVVDPDSRLRRRVKNFLGQRDYRNHMLLTAEQGNILISDILKSGKAASIGKIGASELKVLAAYHRIHSKSGRYSDSDREEILVHSGVHPNDNQALDRFSERWSDDLRQMDVLTVWYNPGERALIEKLEVSANLTALTALEPYYFREPWSHYLEDKRVLVVSPFSQSIEQNYRQRRNIWSSHPNVLPDFSLETLTFPHSPAVSGLDTPSWFALLESMTARIAEKRFDVMLVGAGGMSIPLCAVAKGMGSVGIHLGGSTQILFGIKGGRWDSHPVISKFFNAYWTRPSGAEVPQRAATVENGAYW